MASESDLMKSFHPYLMSSWSSPKSLKEKDIIYVACREKTRQNPPKNYSPNPTKDDLLSRVKPNYLWEVVRHLYNDLDWSCKAIAVAIQRNENIEPLKRSKTFVSRVLDKFGFKPRAELRNHAFKYLKASAKLEFDQVDLPLKADLESLQTLTPVVEYFFDQNWHESNITVALCLKYPNSFSFKEMNDFVLSIQNKKHGIVTAEVVEEPIDAIEVDEEISDTEGNDEYEMFHTLLAAATEQYDNEFVKITLVANNKITEQPAEIVIDLDDEDDYADMPPLKLPTKPWPTKRARESDDSDNSDDGNDHDYMDEKRPKKKQRRATAPRAPRILKPHMDFYDRLIRNLERNLEIKCTPSVIYPKNMTRRPLKE